MSHIRVSRGVIALATALASGAALATSAPVLTLAERAQKSDRVVLARVTGVREQTLNCPPSTPCVGALSVATLTVSENVKGEGPNVVEIALPAHADIAGAAQFATGERALVFLRCVHSAQLDAARANLNDTVAPGAERCSLYGFADAKWAIVKQDARDAVLVPTGLHSSAPRALDEVKAELAAAVRGHAVPTKAAAPMMSTAPRPADSGTTPRAGASGKAIDATDGRIPAPAVTTQPGGAR